jgi:hypothetical protein
MFLMKAMAKLALLCALCVLFGVRSAGAAVTCVENKSTGKFEEKAGKKKVSGECDAQSAMNMVSSVAEVEDLSASEGTTVIGGVIVTNAAQPFATQPTAPAAKLAQAGTGRITTLPSAAGARDVRPVVVGLQAGDEVEVVPATPPAPPKPKWVIEKGQAINAVLEGWAKDAGWSFYWYPAKSWKSLGRADMSDKKDVAAAVAEVISILRAEGKAIKLRISEGNNVREVYSTEVRND